MGNTTKSPKYGKRIVGKHKGRYLTNYGSGVISVVEGNRLLDSGELKLADGVQRDLRLK